MDNIFGERLRMLREEKNLKQEDIGIVVEVGKVTIHGYESGKRKPSFEILIKLASYFNVSTDYLLGVTDKRITPAQIEMINTNGERLNEFLSSLSPDEQNKFFAFLDVTVANMKIQNRP